MSDFRHSEYYRRRADELRLAAGEPCSADNREELLMLAADFDEFADEAESAERSQRGRHAGC